MMQQIRLALHFQGVMVKETKNFDRERRVQSTCFAHFWLAPEGDAACLSALAFRYKPATDFCHKLYEVTVEPQIRAAHLRHSACFIHSHKHTVVSKVQQKTCSVREQRTRAPSILTLSWRILDKPPRWKVVAEPQKDTRILGLYRKRIQSGARYEAWSLRTFV